MKRLLQVAALLLAVSTCANALASGKPPQYDLWLQAAITIDKDGQLTQLKWLSSLPGDQRVAERITPAVRLWEFVPGTVNGQPMETTSGLLVMLHATENVDGTYALRFKDAKTGPLTLHWEHLSYPLEALRDDIGAAVTANVEVSPDGKATVQGMLFAGSSGTDDRAVFLKVVRDSLSKWTYEPERVGGHGVTTHVQIPVAFCTDSTRDWCKRRISSNPKATPANLPIAVDSAVALKTDIRDLKI